MFNLGSYYLEFFVAVVSLSYGLCRINYDSRLVSLKDVEKMLDKKLTDIATKNCIIELKDLILEQSAALKIQEGQIIKLKEDLNSKEDRITVLESQVSVIQNTVNILKRVSDDNEQYSRRLCLRINGIKPVEKKEENANDCLTTVKNVIKELGAEVPNACIDRAHRVGKKYKDSKGKFQQTMIVRFTTWRHRTAVYNARKRQTKYSVRLDLTKKRLELLMMARRYLEDKPSERVDFVFSDVNCRTMAKLSDGTFREFSNIEDFHKIV